MSLCRGMEGANAWPSIKSTSASRSTARTWPSESAISAPAVTKACITVTSKSAALDLAARSLAAVVKSWRVFTITPLPCCTVDISPQRQKTAYPRELAGYQHAPQHGSLLGRLDLVMQ